MKLQSIALSTLLALCGSITLAEDAPTPETAAPVSSEAASQRFSQREDVKAFIDEMVTQYGFDRAQLEAQFDRIVLKPHVLEILDRPSTSRPYYEFRPNFVNATRIRNGVAWWHEHAKTIAAVSEHYHVDPEYLVAILGVETMWGEDAGSFRVMDALSTIAFNYPRRADYFRKELREFLLLAREENQDPFSFKGSYAGAMGMPQFMPSSYRAYAQAWDGNAHRDIWRNPGDTLASIANYFSEHGWTAGTPLVARAQVQGADFAPLVDDKFNLHYKVSELAPFGVTPAKPLSDDPLAVLAPLDTAPGTTDYWLGYNNFVVITRYNHSTLYAMAVHELAQAIKAAYLDPSLLPPAPHAKKVKKKHLRMAGG
ncbi:MAG: lytic murein transglycosylase B [Burkholderiales bacterium]|nr:lytic murein transglycosylase B [Burkholderiales bacterium]